MRGQYIHCENILKEAVADPTWVSGQFIHGKKEAVADPTRVRGQYIHCENILKEAVADPT